MHRLAKSKALLTHISKTFDTLPFCRRWLDRGGQEKVSEISSIPH